MTRSTPSWTRRAYLAAAAGAAALLPRGGGAQPTYPAGSPVRVVAGYAPGSTSDIVGRLVADRLAARWGVPVVVENVAGANGNLANERVARGPADGSQLLVATVNLATNQFLYPRLGYDPERDLVPVSCVARLPNLLVVRRGLPAGSVADLIAHARADPGRLNYGSPGVGSSIHLAAEMFQRMTGTRMTHVGYRGSGPALQDLAAGTIDLIFDNITAAIGLVRDGRIRGLAVTGAGRTPLAPDFPAVAETVPGFEVTSFHGIAVRAGTPGPIVATIERDVVALSREPAARERLAGIAAEAIGSGGAEFAETLARERVRWDGVIRDLGLRIE